MKFSDFGLVNTRDMFRDALRNKYAIGAFNVYNMETIMAVITAARESHSPVILAVSESALNYMGANMLMSMIWASDLRPTEQIALHLDHGHSYEACATAIDIGFSSVMIDASALPFYDNIALSARVAEYAHARNISVEAELGVLRGHEDENTKSEDELFTHPDDVVEFVSKTDIDSLAIAIGTSHGAYKRKSANEKLRFDILAKIAENLPDFPLVLHGASCVPEHLIHEINANGGDINGAHGIPVEQLRMAAQTNICKINIDTDSRLAFTAGVRVLLNSHPENFNPREYLGAGMDMMYENTVTDMHEIMNSANRLK